MKRTADEHAASSQATRRWTPSRLGRLIARSPAWTLSLGPDALALERADGSRAIASLAYPLPLAVRDGRFFARVVLASDTGERIIVGGLPKAEGSLLLAAVREALAALHARRKELWERRRALEVRLDALLAWHERVEGFLAARAERGQWIPRERVRELLADALLHDARPETLPEALGALLAEPDDADGPHSERLAQAVAALERWQGGLASAVDDLNDGCLLRERRWMAESARGSAYASLTDEQARAVITFDERVLVVAAAGSGKTHVMMAKALYAIERGLCRPDEILMLAFNRSAAKELATRTARALREIGYADISVDATTFHALGARLEGRASGEKKRAADWLDDGRAVAKLGELAVQLARERPMFRVAWHLLLALEAARGREGGNEVLEPAGRDARHETLRGERVASLEEVAIADWLFLHGIEYAYEAPYPHRTATATYAQYRPDFFYPAIDLWHEHFALDADGQPPRHFAGYLDGVAWKRRTHAEHGTTLFETSSHELRCGKLFWTLEHVLRSHGLEPRLDPGRLPPNHAVPAEHARRTLELARGFLGHRKANGIGAETLERRLAALFRGSPPLRERLFLDVALDLGDAWDAALARVGCIDFDDMLALGARALETDQVPRPWRLVMVDEFQDVSPVRRRMIAGLVSGPARTLFAVGDDWQSIYRFAGADRSVMQRFDEAFGTATLLRLERTFRFPQPLADASGAFVQRNPAQIRKRVRSAVPADGPTLRAIEVADEAALGDALAAWLDALARRVAGGGPSPTTSVLVLVRFNREKSVVPESLAARLAPTLAVSTSTIHRVKGGEADHVVIARALEGSLPSTIEDDPLMRLVLPEEEPYPDAEERRVFYVALTRARRSVTLFTVRGSTSPFLRELVGTGAVRLENVAGDTVSEAVCEGCGAGLLVSRSGPYGPFLGCERFPRCRYTAPCPARAVPTDAAR